MLYNMTTRTRRYKSWPERSHNSNATRRLRARRSSIWRSNFKMPKNQLHTQSKS